MKTPTKTEQIIAMIRDGKSDEEIIAEFNPQAPFLKRCHTQAKKEIEAESNKEKKVPKSKSGMLELSSDIHEDGIAVTPPQPQDSLVVTPEMMKAFLMFSQQMAEQGQSVARQ